MDRSNSIELSSTSGAHKRKSLSSSDAELEKGDGNEDLNRTTTGEVVRADEIMDLPQGTKRNLKSRHLAMIALGGTIGTGLFVGSGTALASAGPIGCLLAYIVMGTVVYLIMIALGEMTTLFPNNGGFTGAATRFLDPAFGFAIGWNYYWSWAITIPVELVAGSLLISYWDPTTSAAAYITPLWITMIVINLAGVRWYGEIEYWTSALKITAIVGFIIMGIAFNCGAGPAHAGYIGFRYWKDPGPFAQFSTGGVTVEGRWGQFVAFWSAFVTAAFSFLGTEIVALTAGEAENPRKNVPKAIRRTFWRILIFYVLSIFIIGILVAYTDERLLNSDVATVSQSPFVIAINNAGVKGLSSVVNAVLLIAVWSAGNSDVYASSRVLYALALEGKAPAFLRKCTKRGLPVYAVSITAVVFGALSFMTLGNDGANEVFNWLYNISTITGIVAWAIILMTYLRFYYGMRHQGLSRDELPYKAPFQPYASWIALVFISLVALFNGFHVFVGDNFTASDFIAAYIGLIGVFIFWAGWKCFGGKRTRRGQIFAFTKHVTLDDMDFVSGRREFDELDEAEAIKEANRGPRSFWQRFVDFIF